MRQLDLPKHKETVSSEIFGTFIGIVNSFGFEKEKDYATIVKPVLDCSNKVLFLDEINNDYQLNVVVKSFDMSVEVAYFNKETKEVLFREKLNGLRYNLSDNTSLELTSGSQNKFNVFLDGFNFWLEKLIASNPY